VGGERINEESTGGGIWYFLYMYKHGTSKAVAVILRGMGMN
jgi:hypothetical protein